MSDKELDAKVAKALKERLGRPPALTQAQRIQVKQEYVAGKSVCQLAIQWKVSRSTIMKALKS